MIKKLDMCIDRTRENLWQVQKIKTILNICQLQESLPTNIIPYIQGQFGIIFLKLKMVLDSHQVLMMHVIF
jgi:hypothetical protein